MIKGPEQSGPFFVGDCAFDIPIDKMSTIA